jgi:dihydrofolate reductase
MMARLSCLRQEDDMADPQGRGRILIDLFTTLDGVAQAPGAPGEDPSGGFRFGGWQAPVSDDLVGREVMAGIESLDALLLGRRTYDIFAAYWPRYEGEDSPIARIFNRVPKYVASRGTPVLDWAGSSQLGPDILTEVDALRDRHREIHVIGSVDFAHSLLAAQLFDELVLWMFPVVLGEGKKVFPDGAVPANLRLTAPPVASGTGAVLLHYAPAGEPRTGDMSQAGRGV